MTSLIRRIISVYRNEGILTLVQKSINRIYELIYCNLMAIRGSYSLMLADYTVTFSAPTSTMVRRNRRRFISENNELQAFINEIENNDVVYDIGANTGLYTLFAAKASSDGTVVAFEPYPPNLNLLRQDITENRLQNVEVIDVALSDSTGTVEFNQPSEVDVGYGSSSIELGDSDATISVPTSTGDQLVTNGDIPSPNVIKVDVEGSEPLVLEGLSKILSNPDCRTVFCEVHLPAGDHRPSIEDFGSSAENIKNKLKEYGFEIEQLDSRGNEIFYKCRK